MAESTKLLNDDGAASMATLLMMSHHAFRRDIARFALALEQLTDDAADKIAALQEEWRFYRGALHGHHTIEDTQIFPHLKAEHESLGSVIDRLSADHRCIEPLLEHGDSLFADLPKVRAEAVELAVKLAELLDKHLELEEAEVVSYLRKAKEFPSPANDDEAVMYAQGFSWSMHGIAPEVLSQVVAMLPENLTSRLPDACKAFAARCVRVWGSASAGASYTSVPDQ